MTRRSSLLLRAAAAVVLFLSLGGPGPGAVGGCGWDRPEADAGKFCEDKARALCYRKFANTGDQNAFNTCAGAISMPAPTGCRGVTNWNGLCGTTGPRPDVYVVQACLNALRSDGNLSLDDTQILAVEECQRNFLCGVTE